MAHHRKFQISVIGDSTADAEKYTLAEKVGRVLGELECVVITGGRGGVMEAVSKGAAEKGALTIGILPGDNIDQANKYCQVVIPTGMGHARNVLTAIASDLVVVIGGGAGTLSEVSFAWIHKKPVIVMGASGGWSGKLGGIRLDERRQDQIIDCKDTDQLRDLVMAYRDKLTL
jgi:uncharacterized protein (TIGR00725 family)